MTTGFEILSGCSREDIFPPPLSSPSCCVHSSVQIRGYREFLTELGEDSETGADSRPSSGTGAASDRNS